MEEYLGDDEEESEPLLDVSLAQVWNGSNRNLHLESLWLLLGDGDGEHEDQGLEGSIGHLVKLLQVGEQGLDVVLGEQLAHIGL